MLEVKISYDYDNDTMTIQSKDSDGEKHNKKYSECSNWYDMTENLEDFISTYIEESDDEDFDDEDFDDED